MTEIYVDGYCYGNPGPGAWAYRIFYPGEITSEMVYGKEYYATNNKVELLALVNALKAVKALDPIIIFTGSTYIINLVSNPDWVIRNNNDLVDEMRDLLERKNVSLHQVSSSDNDRLYAVRVLAKRIASE